MFRDVAIIGVIAWTSFSNTLQQQEGVGDSSSSSEFKDNQFDMNMDVDSLLQGHTNQSRCSGHSELVNQYPPHRRKRRR